MTLSKSYDPLKKQRLQILDSEGNVVNPQLEPKIPEEKLLKMYKTMVLARVSDIKAVQYQRQGRMLSYVINRGHEGGQVGSAAALEDQDWVSPYFRDIGIYLYRGIPLENIYLYWYGNEKGSKMDPSKRILPVNIIIGSGINIGAGLALASKLQNKKEVTIATIGDGGTAHEEFYAGLNYASVYKAPLVVLIQNNQYAISTPRKVASNSETLAQKSYAFGIPGIQVDGNDVLAVYAAVKEFTEAARNGEGASLIEIFTYRMGAHTTNDNPNLYRSKEEEEEWNKKDPIERFKKYLLKKNVLTEEMVEQINQEAEKYVSEVHEKITSYGANVEPIEIFEHLYYEMTPQLKEQHAEYEQFLKSKEEGK
ncbi:MAG: pyruvate dehydrogenase E1 component subunit alpha [Candidatus Phytoplasma pruni]|uniref:pyruvate dehydrogenase (acetyl-transferring) E1 component subunit alpha n=1 Tax=Poinsettia branch-inducing phytoplasma TaxID=138647 RepID=UPI00035CAC2F|nr:pyruvate dehydrogenase (acetyl-transferring) E1 component subunit alpha [Poinsettia branch-inducing phytoplasma]WEK82676.1 MAG: pyruvate dehydrogenase E1 component subunit alpha [Candidatus Phytoplasma pruni]